MFGVYDNGKPASEVGYPELSGRGWVTHTFASFNAAEEYACQWLGEYADGLLFCVDRPEDYSGYGDIIVIKREASEGG